MILSPSIYIDANCAPNIFLYKNKNTFKKLNTNIKNIRRQFKNPVYNLGPVYVFGWISKQCKKSQSQKD